jgi:hypothetical protein
MNRTPSQRLVSHKLKAAGRVARATARKADNQSRKPGYKARLAMRKRTQRQAGEPARRAWVKNMLASTR